jgi:hypothetical protein
MKYLLKKYKRFVLNQVFDFHKVFLKDFISQLDKEFYLNYLTDVALIQRVKNHCNCLCSRNIVEGVCLC